MKQDDRYYFEWALQLAKSAFEKGFSPVGAVVVADDGVMWGAASRRLIGNHFHAELLAMGDYQNSGVTGGEFTLYSTLEPCVMCAGMAAVLHVDHIKWLVDDIWAGTRLLNYNMPYVRERFPTMDKIDLPDLHRETQDLWVKYLRSTGHADAVDFMLGLPEDYQCK